ncbi:MAG: hypothetical protein DRP47_00110 [Candidatus Zixiibacteriota bacterium]|nr:MAG: hypothetical protein DRP47_00110 [candidate division Zixibacteria bacterium]
MNEANGNMSEALCLNVLYTNIGRGHPFYLDGIMEAMIRQGTIAVVRNKTDVFDLSRGSALLAWKAARWIYSHGSSGLLGNLYSHLRSNRNYNRRNRFMTIMGRDIIRHFNNNETPLLVAHPSLVGILADRQNLMYQHGELVAPSESLVLGANKVFVPTADVADKFIAAGYNSEKMMITGLCIEPALVRQAKDTFDMRIKRYRCNKPLTGAFFSSGAEPQVHTHMLVAAAISLVKEENKVVVIARHGGRLAKAVKAAFSAAGFELAIIDRTDAIPHNTPPVLLVLHRSRREENILTAHLFERFDFLVAPAHERTNWAMGLGLPMFAVFPHIGPFAPANMELVVKSGVGEELRTTIDARLLGTHIKRYHSSGRLLEMAKRGWGRKIDGFSQIAKFLITK